ncbi:MAG: RibD family protein [Rhizobiales bacterium]|nr:RibD family protein [Hyphomicrobiales bacterium]
MMVVAQLGQTMDGRTATEKGHSHYINGNNGLDHLHRLRACVDAVVIGVGTACADDPQLTVRRVEGGHPARVIVDPNGRLPAAARVLAEDGIRRLVIRRPEIPDDLPDNLPAGVEIVRVPPGPDGLAPADILAALAERGLFRVLIEGGSNTVSRFLAARCLDHLHIVTAPLILGSGPPGLVLAPVARMDEALRPRTQVHILSDEVLYACDFSDQRVAIGRAKKSM